MTRKALLGTALFSAVAFGASSYEEVACYRYACYPNGTTFKWLGVVEVWFAKDLPEEARAQALRALKSWATISGFKYEVKEAPYESGELYDECFDSDKARDLSGIVVAVLPEECRENESGIIVDEEGNDVSPSEVGGSSLSVGLRGEEGRVAEGVVLVGINPTYFYDLTTFAHEIGHAIGLGHPFEYGESGIPSVMQWVGPLLVLGSQHDADVSQYLYGQPEEAPPLEVVKVITNGGWTTYYCALGGKYPYYFRSNCTLREVEDSLLCFVLEGEGTCEVEVSSSDGQVITAQFELPTFSVSDGTTTTTTTTTSSDGGGGGGGCTTGGGDGGLLALAVALGAFVRRIFRRW